MRASAKATHASTGRCLRDHAVADVLDRVDQFDDLDPRRDYHLTVTTSELSDVERAARALGDRRTVGSVDDVDLEL